MKILITGGNGFVGSRLALTAQHQGMDVLTQVRSGAVSNNQIEIKDISPDTDWGDCLQGVDVIVHCAARVHQMNDDQDDALESYRRVNTEGTLRLAQQAADVGVKRFVFLSTIKVNGEFTEKGKPFTPNVVTAPKDPYGLSKYEAEQRLTLLAKETGLEVVIIRPPLVYGEGVKANFLSMINIVRKGLPLPFGAIKNQRSLVYLDNLISLILACCKHPKAAGKVFLVSDNHDVSTSLLFRQVAASLGKPNRLIPVPQWLLELVATLLGRRDIAQRLCGNLQVDVSDTIRALGWQPPYTFKQGIENTVTAYKEALSESQ
ncbi:UDP-glucose 4-epimerase family protein [Enterovibrio coralii]|uniref:NAD-dependent dehydratase n=1 Tax=Enterovibrio coralii TaxID=294935 RepID=A0A135I7F1_9GAMM|nr:SDR family oxidoreductase [Enterovibrio coralii]KXF81380.1 NAD-dependent dehydratase [Enterovibrio coralii]